MAPKKAAIVETKTKKKSMKKQKDKDAPKRALTPYMFYASERRKQVVKDRPELQTKVAEVAKIIGADWQNLTERDKAVFEKMSADDKVRYQKEKAEYESKRK